MAIFRFTSLLKVMDVRQCLRTVIALLLSAAVLLTSAPWSAGKTSGDKNQNSKAEPGGPTIEVPPTNKDQGLPQFPTAPQRQQPRAPETKQEREGRVARIKLSVDREQSVASGQRFSIGAVPVDRDSNAIHGLRADWSSSNKQIVFVTKDGQATAGNPGTAHLVAQAGGRRETVVIHVYDGGPDRKKRTAISSQRPDLLARAKRKAMYAHALMPEAPDDRLPDTETSSLYQPYNKVGKPPGKTEAGASTAAVANSSTETPGSANYTFSLGIDGLPGRQLDAPLGLTYNNRIWHKVVTGSTTKLYFDVDYSWPAPGFRLGYGQIEYQGTAGFTLIDPDGTRHQMTSIGSSQFRATDGSIITYAGSQYGGTVTYPDGTRVIYSATNGPRSYPTKVIDRHGNYSEIHYVGNVGPKISLIVDTLGRYFQFHYAGGELIAITAPGYNNSQTDRQVARFYYETLDFPQYGMFLFGMSVTKPAQTRILRYVYLPGLQNGYRYDYIPYGMINRTSQLRGMTVDTLSLTAMGSVTLDGQTAANTYYTFETGDGLNPNQTNAPKYNYRTDSWAGMTVSPPVWAFTADQENGITTVYNPDGRVVETQSNPLDGQVQSVTTKFDGAVLSKIGYSWTWSTVGPRLEKIETTNEASQTRATKFEYDPDTIFNNVLKVSERDFAEPGVLGAELRRTETTYENSTNYTNRGLIHLPKTVKIFAGGSDTPSSHKVYSYDANTLVDRPGIFMHEPSYNPYSEPGEDCQWQWNGWNDVLICSEYPVYNEATAYRGNITSITSYADAANTSGAKTDTFSYDIAGNVTEQSVNCCRRKTYAYSSSYNFAYVTSETRGDAGQLETQATFDFNTGLVRTMTDENGQPSTIHYYPDSLRYHRTDFPNGGYTSIEYNDALIADPDPAHMHSSTMTTTATSVSTVIRSYDYFDGRGAVVRRMGEFTAADNGRPAVDVEYDALGRVRRVSNPYYASSGASSPINPTDIWTETYYDGLGRVYHVNIPSGDLQNPTTANVHTSYWGTITTLRDQAGKQRRQKVDALGRVVRLDEPDASGNLGEVPTPAQATYYEYDTLNNLIHIMQGDQHRYFKYDSLSRLTHERQVEQDAPWTTTESVAGNNYWSRKIVYTPQGQIEDAYDARQMRTNYVYDGLNRIKEVHYFGSNGQPDPATPDAFYWYDGQTLPPGGPTFDRGYATGRLVAMTYGGTTANPNPTGNYFGYNNRGRVERQRQVTGANTYALTYTYNLAGQLKDETYPSNRTITHTYDDAGRVSQISQGVTIYANGFAYQPHGGLSSETFGNGMVHSLGYNRRLQTSEVKLKQSSVGAELQRYNYSYGEVNQTNGSIDTTKNNGQIGRVEGYINGAKQWDQRMSYDSLGRLSTGAEYRGDNGNQTWQAHYDYDRFGNRFQYRWNSNLTYTSVQEADIDPGRNRFIESGATPINYDPAGNILTDAKFRNLKYEYDINGRQTRAKAMNNTEIQTSVYDSGGQRVQTTAPSTGLTRTMVYDIFGQNVADYTGTGATLERENIYRGAQLLATETPPSAAPSGLTTTAASSNVSLNWTAAAGATNYRVERREAGQDYSSVGNTTSTSFIDSGAQLGKAYLYRVCTANGGGACTSDFTNVGLGARVNFPTDPNITSIADDPTGLNVTAMKVEHITELRTAVNAVRSLAGQPPATWTHPTIVTGDTIYKDDVQDLRDSLHDALLALEIQTSAYADTPLAGAPNGTLIRAVHIRELRERTTSGVAAGGGGGTTGGLQYVLSDLQGSARAVMNNNGIGTSTIIARHDYLPFGEEIGSNVGLRTSGQGYGVLDSNRWKYGMTERDASGLDHTWWRKYENTSGRWTSPDPLGSSMTTGDAQSFNRYVYTQNDPVNAIDPSGLMMMICGYSGAGDGFSVIQCDLFSDDSYKFGGYWGSGRGGADTPMTPEASDDCRKKALETLAQELAARQEVFPPDSERLMAMISTGATGAKVGGAAGSVLVPGPGSVAGAAVGAAVGVTVGAFISDVREARVEQGPVNRFREKEKECNKQERKEAARHKVEGTAMGPGPPPQMFVVTRQFGTFAMYDYTIRSGPTLLGDYIYTTYGRSPGEPVKTRFGR